MTEFNLSDYLFQAKILENPTINEEAILSCKVKEFIRLLKMYRVNGVIIMTLNDLDKLTGEKLICPNLI